MSSMLLALSAGAFACGVTHAFRQGNDSVAFLALAVGFAWVWGKYRP